MDRYLREHQGDITAAPAVRAKRAPRFQPSIYHFCRQFRFRHFGVVGYTWGNFMRRWLLLFLLLAPALTAADSKQPYSKSAELLCDQVKITVTTSCTEDSYPAYPTCQKQQFMLTNLKTGKSLTRKGEGKLEASAYPNEAPRLDGLAARWTCLQGKDTSYLVVEYYSGGNCPECEWSEIYDLTGKHLTPNSRKDRSVSSKRFSELRLSIEEWKKSLVNIPLRRAEK